MANSGSYLLPNFTPFQSGCSMCKPSSDYYKAVLPQNTTVVTQGGARGRSKSRRSSSSKSKSPKRGRSKTRRSMRGGADADFGAGHNFIPSNYSSTGGLIPISTGADLYKAPKFERTFDQKFIDENMGKTYATSFGGAKKRKTKKTSKSRSRSRSSSKSRSTKKTIKKTIKKKTTKRRKMRGGAETEGATFMTPQFYNSKMSTPSFSADSGLGAMTAYGSASPRDIGVGMLAPYNMNPNGNQASMQKTGGKKRSTKSKSRSRSRSSSKSRKVKKTKKTTKRRKMRGGSDSTGVMNTNTEVSPNDMSVSMLAPYTMEPKVNKTGGKKRTRSSSKSKRSKSKKSMKKTKSKSKKSRSRSKSRKH